MRLFVSLALPPEAVQPVADAVAELGAVPGVRWSPPHRWHLTLAFLGEVDDDAAAALVAPLRPAVAACRPPRLRLSGAGCFGDRVLWAGVAGDLSDLAELVSAVEGAALRTGQHEGQHEREHDRVHRPHVTLARAAGRAGATELPQLAAQLAPVSGATWTASEAQLVRSHTSDGRYEVLERFPVGGGRP